MKFHQLELIYNFLETGIDLKGTDFNDWETFLKKVINSNNTFLLEKILEDSKIKINSQIPYFVDINKYDLREGLEDFINSKKLEAECDFNSVMEELIDYFWSNNLRNEAIRWTIYESVSFLSELDNKKNLKNLHLFLMKNAILYLETKEKKENLLIKERVEILSFFIAKTFMSSSFLKENKKILVLKFKKLVKTCEGLLEDFNETLDSPYSEMFSLVQQSNFIAEFMESVVLNSKSNLITQDEKLKQFDNSLSFLIKKFHQQNFQYTTTQLVIRSILDDILPDLNLTYEQEYTFVHAMFAYMALLYNN
jgi:hypothetical protein